MTTPAPTTSASQTLAPSLVRTAVPFLAGLIATWLAERLGLPVDSATVGALLTALFGYAYYVVARFLEVYASSKWGYILGLTRTPTYAAGVVDVVGRHERGEGGSLSVRGGIGVLAVLGVIVLVVGLLTDNDTVVIVGGALVAAGVVAMVFSPQYRR